MGVRRAVTSRDGLAVVYLMAVVNAALVCLTAFGIDLSTAQVAAVTSLANAVLVAAAHLLRLTRPTAAAAGGKP